MSGRKRLELHGFENEFVRVVREAVGDEVPPYAKQQRYWFVQCKGCETVKKKKSSEVVRAEGCASCRIKRMNANKDPDLEAKAKEAWPNLVRGVQDMDLDVIEESVKVLRRYERRFLDAMSIGSQDR